MGLRAARSRLPTVVAILGAGGIASFAAGWHAPHVPGLTPSDMIALRFAETWNEVSESSASADRAEFDAAAERRMVLFNPYPLYRPNIAPSSTASLAALPVAARIGSDTTHVPEAVAAVAPPAETRARQATYELPGQARKPAVAPAPRVPPRPATVLNDAQIASIKKRLNLSPDQEHMWPSVEAALRKLVYAKAPGAPRSQTSHVIDPNGSELQHLKSAAVPLVMSFNSDQKRELRTLVQVMGLEKLASQI